MKLLVLGGDGMLGHEFLRLAVRHDVHVTLRRPVEAYSQYGIFTRHNATGDVDAGNLSKLAALIARHSPDAVINCIGIIKQRLEAKSAIPSIEINALFPHRLLEMCSGIGSRLVHFSTDCVFSGHVGNRRETDNPDPVDLYGRSKLLGEIDRAPGLTLRSSIIGLELGHNHGLIEWFLSQHGTVRGFRRAIYTGLTTLEMVRLVERLLEQHPALSGVWQVASAPINKYDLLVNLANKLGRTDVEIVADDGFVCDRSLRSDAFAAATGYQAPAWDDMLTELARDINQRSHRAA